MSRTFTIKDVARAAQVSTATVSNAINRPARVSAETRARVLKVASELGYVPYAAAVYGKSTNRHRIGVIAPFTTHPSYAERLAGVLRVLATDQTEALVFDHPSASRSPSPRLAALPFSGRIDGLLILGVPVDTDLCDRLVEREVPTVLIDSSHPRLTSVVLDEAVGAALVAEHLIANGYEQFVYITEGQRSNEYISQGRKRMAGFVRALTERGVAESRITNLTARAGDVAAGRAAARVIAQKAPSGRVGVLAGHDVLAAGVVAGLRECRIHVPDAIGVVGWDGGDLVEALGLTTVRQPLAESGRLGAERLVALLRDPDQPVERISLSPTLRVGMTA